MVWYVYNRILLQVSIIILILTFIVAHHQDGVAVDDEFNGKILPEEKFDAMTPPKLRSPVIKEKPKRRPKKAQTMIPLPKFLSNKVESEDIEKEDIEIVKLKQSVAVISKPFQQKRKQQRKSTLTVPKSPLFQTSV